MKCNLCKIKEANQTGSHITSAFLLTSQLGKRGEEKGYLITTNPEKDYSINHGDKGVKEDYILCRDCEKRLGIVEEIYATGITHKIEEKRFEQNFNKIELENGYYKLESLKVNSIVFQLLIQSNIWRASVSNQELFSHFKLAEELEERMRFNLDLFLPTIIDFKVAQSNKEWIKMIINCQDLFDFIPLSIVKAENIENKDMTFEFFDNVSKSPYHIILNENFIFIFNDKLDWDDDFFDLKHEFDVNDIINNGFHNPVIGVVANERFMKTIHKIKDIAVKKRIGEIEKKCVAEMIINNVPVTPENIRKMVIEEVNKIKKYGS